MGQTVTLDVLRTVLVTILLAISAVTLWRGWMAPAGDSLWLDECGTVWTISGGWPDVWQRTAIHPNSRAYGLGLWAWALVFGKGELALRLPSVLLMAGAMAMLAAILRRRVGVGWPVFAFAAMSPEMQFFGIDARPYALAVFGYSLASYALLRFEEERRARWGWLWAGAAGLTFSAHAVVGVVLAAHLAWILWRDWRRWLSWLPYALAAGLLMAAELWRLSPGLAAPDRHTFSFSPDFATWLRAVFPLSAIVPFGVAAVAFWGSMRRNPDRKLLLLAGLTIALPCLLLVLLSVRSWSGLLVARYVIFVWWGWFLLIGILCAAWLDARGRLLFVTIYAATTMAGSLYKTGWRVPHTESDWRGALAAARAWDSGRARPIALHTGFVEGSFADWLDDPKKREFLKAPFYAYPYPGESHILPYWFDPARLPKLERPYVMVVYEDSLEMSKYVAAMAPDARPLGKFLRLRVYAAEADAR